MLFAILPHAVARPQCYFATKGAFVCITAGELCLNHLPSESFSFYKKTAQLSLRHLNQIVCICGLALRMCLL